MMLKNVRVLQIVISILNLVFFLHSRFHIEP